MVWVVRKIRHMIEASVHKIIIYTDHSTTVFIVRQMNLNTISVKKLNFRLMRASEFLQPFRLDVRFKPDKTNIILNALSRLANKQFQSPKQSLDVL